MIGTRTAPAVAWLVVTALLLSMFAGFGFTRAANAQVSEFTISKDDARAVLSTYATDLSDAASQGRLETVHGFDAEIDRVIGNLANGFAKAPVVVSASDVDRAAIARGVAWRVASGAVPVNLQGKRVFSLNLDALAKDAKTPREFNQRVHSVFAAAAVTRNEIILFVDQLHQYAGARATTAASATIRRAIAAHHLSVIGGASPEAYESYIGTDDTVASLFETIALDAVESADNTTARTDKRKSPINQEFEGEKIAPDMRDLMASAGPNGQVSAIVQVSDVNSRQVRSLLARYGVTVGDRMPNLGAMKVDLRVEAIDALMKSNSMNFISPNRNIELLGHITSTTGTDQVRNAPGLISGLLGSSAIDGTGIGIAILDSGLDTSHAAFAKDLLGAGRVKVAKDFTGENTPSTDPYGHGTHVTGSAAGISTTSGSSYEGIAPNANIIVLRVLNKNGVGTTAGLLSALNWILAPVDPTKPISSTNPLNKDKYNIRVVNMSLGAPAVDSYKNDPICRASRALVDAGIVVVAAAGNNGKDVNGNKIYGQIHSPGNEPSVITVGAANSFGTDSHNDDAVASYSSRGPTRSRWTDANGSIHYDNLLKPDLVAPGNKLIFAEADTSTSAKNLLVTQNPQLDSGISDSNNRRLMYLSGTSMATPVVAGAAALLLQINPKLTPNMVKMALMYSADPLPGWNILEQGAGELNVEGAARLAKLIRTDLNSSTQPGTPMLNGPAPTPQTTISGYTFTGTGDPFQALARQRNRPHH